MLELGIDALVDGYRRRAFSPVDVMMAVLDRAAALQPTLNPFAAIDEDGALAAEATGKFLPIPADRHPALFADFLEDPSRWVGPRPAAAEPG